jgi:hypothetical protein
MLWGLPMTSSRVKPLADNELLVAVGDVAGKIGATDDGGAVGDGVFVRCDGQILTHDRFQGMTLP